jgi:hypothetical protein
MGKRAIRQDMILKGLDPNNVEIGEDGLFVSKKSKSEEIIEEIVESNNTNETKKLKNAFVILKNDKDIEVKPKTKKQKTLDLLRLL